MHAYMCMKHHVLKGKMGRSLHSHFLLNIECTHLNDFLVAITTGHIKTIFLLQKGDYCLRHKVVGAPIHSQMLILAQRERERERERERNRVK